MYNRVTLLYSGNEHNTVNQLYFNKTIFLKKVNEDQELGEGRDGWLEQRAFRAVKHFRTMLAQGVKLTVN